MLKEDALKENDAETIAALLPLFHQASKVKSSSQAGGDSWNLFPAD